MSARGNTAGSSRGSEGPPATQRAVSAVSGCPKGNRSISFTVGLKRKRNEQLHIDINTWTVSDIANHLQPYVLTLEQQVENGYPRPSDTDSHKAIILNSRKKITDPSIAGGKRTCSRCGASYRIDDVTGDYVTEEECVYHWSRPWRVKVCGQWTFQYPCCQSEAGSLGCSTCPLHVTECADLTGYHGTRRSKHRSGAGTGTASTPGVYALDCEMCYTMVGLELTRITVVDTNNTVVYETLVKPDSRVIDYNTRFSGLKAEHLESVTTSLRDVQRVLVKKFTSDTILIGHSLESDLIALKLFHDRVVDTSVVFPHRQGLPYKRALRNLMGDYLQKIIQDSVNGHDSKEDAISCMELMLWKIKEDAKKRI